MEQQPAKKRRGPASKLGKILINLIVTAVVGFLYFYVALPPINLQSSDFYTFIGILCVVYVVSALITSGMNVVSSGGGPKEYLRFIKTQCLPVGILFLALIAVAIVGSVLWQSMALALVYGGDAKQAFFLAKLVSRSIQFALTGTVDTLIVWLLLRRGALNGVQRRIQVKGGAEHDHQ